MWFIVEWTDCLPLQGDTCYIPNNTTSITCWPNDYSVFINYIPSWTREMFDCYGWVHSHNLNVPEWTTKIYYQYYSRNYNLSYKYESNKMPVSQLTPVVDWLENTIVEFIPYIVYIGLWVLSALLWFIAIKWLVNWTRSKSLWVFSSRRKKK